MEEKTYYEDCRPIEPQKSTAWLVTFLKNEQKEIHIWHEHATMEEVVSGLRDCNLGKKFYVEAITVGSYSINKCLHAYFHDGRKVHQDFTVTID